MMRDENVSAKGEETTYIHSIQNSKTFPSSLSQLPSLIHQEMNKVIQYMETHQP